MNEKRQCTDANMEVNQMVELSGKEFKATIIKINQLITINSVVTDQHTFLQQDGNYEKEQNENYRTGKKINFF